MLLKKIILLALLIATSSLNAGVEDGEELFNDSKCLECHELDHFQHDDKKISNFKKLHTQVEACAISNNAQWFDDEMKDVSYYLNHKYYKYKLKEGE